MDTQMNHSKQGGGKLSDTRLLIMTSKVSGRNPGDF